MKREIDDNSFDEALMEDEFMPDSFIDDDDDGEDWTTLIGVLVLLLTLFGQSSIGVIANLVPASDGFVQQA